MLKTCYLDVDGILADFVSGALAAHGKTLPYAETRWGFPEQIGFSGVDEPLFWLPLGYDFWRNLPLCPDAHNLVVAVESRFSDRVVLMTSPCDTPGAVEGKVDWIRHHLPEYRRRFFVGPAKHLAAAPCKLLIDDHDGNCDRFVAEGGNAWSPPRPWNRHAVRALENGDGNRDHVLFKKYMECFE